MTNRDLVALLLEFPPDHTVTVSDGFIGTAYSLDRSIISLFKEDDGSMSIDIGVGGCEI